MIEFLTQMLTQQRELQIRLGYDFEKMTTEERVTYIKEMYIAATQELGEALNETTWKSWASGNSMIHIHEFTGELTDTWQFIANMWFAALPDASPEYIAHVMYDRLAAKIRINHKRADANYDGKNKCPQCKRALDDPAVECELVPQGYHCAKTGVTYWTQSPAL